MVDGAAHKEKNDRFNSNPETFWSLLLLKLRLYSSHCAGVSLATRLGLGKAAVESSGKYKVLQTKDYDGLVFDYYLKVHTGAQHVGT